MSIFRTFKSFCYGCLSGGFITALYLHTGFAELLSDLEIIWASLIASLAWWFKTSFEKWSNEKRAIAKLQRIYSRNIDTLIRLVIIKNQLLQNVVELKAGSVVKYVNHIEFLNVPDEEIIDSIRNIKLLNVVFKNKIAIDRYNSVLGILWEHYNRSFTEAREKDSPQYLKEALGDFDSSLGEFITDAEILKNELIFTQANLYVSGKKICESLFQKTTSFFIYTYEDVEVEQELDELSKKIKTI